MPTPPHHEPGLPAAARASLAQVLDALEAHTDAPLRLRGHASERGYAIFDLQEEPEVGRGGRRYLTSVGPEGREVLLLPLDPGPEAA